MTRGSIIRESFTGHCLKLEDEAKSMKVILEALC